MTTRRLNPLRWPLTVRIPLVVVVLMVAVAIAISNVVLRRLASDQEMHLQALADSYLDGLSAAVQPNLLRRDIWETFDALDRARGLYRALQTKYALVTLTDGTVLAASDPAAFPPARRCRPCWPNASRPATAWCWTRSVGAPGCVEP
jgi:Glutamine phosphoribosylpyrophosphate amidotransferase